MSVILVVSEKLEPTFRPLTSAITGRHYNYATAAKGCFPPEVAKPSLALPAPLPTFITLQNAAPQLPHCRHWSITQLLFSAAKKLFAALFTIPRQR